MHQNGNTITITKGIGVSIEAIAIQFCITRIEIRFVKRGR